MKISVFGLGYVGCVSAACLAQEGNDVIGVDINPDKTDIIKSGRSPIIEKDIDQIINTTVEKGHLTTTVHAKEAIDTTNLSIVCVGTPSNENGSLDLSHIKKVCSEIGSCLREKPDYHLIIIRSTMLPGSIEGELIPILEKASGKKAASDFGICINPEFLREGTSVFDYYNPPLILIGAMDKKSADITEQMYAGIKAPVVKTDIKVAEMIKYASNTFHALKVCFANEIGNICKKQNIDSHKVMEIFCMDTKLNISPYYLKPGFAFGGSCLPKDLRALLYKGHSEDLLLPLLDSILKSNANQIKTGIDCILKTKKKKVGFFGFSFKAGTDDLRESPLVELIETLIGKGYRVKIYDKNVSIAKIYGANKRYIEKEIPHIASLMCSSIEEILNESEVLVIGNNSDEFKEIPKQARDDQVIIDLVKVIDNTHELNSNYCGICW